MGVHKYRSCAEMPGPTSRPPLHPDNLRLACALSDLALRLAQLRRPPGVRRHRSYDALHESRDAD